MKTTTLTLAMLFLLNVCLKAQIIPTGDLNIANILKTIKVDANDRYAIGEAYKIKLEANKCLNITIILYDELEQLKEIEDMALQFEEIKIKTQKIIELKQNEIIDKKLDALESFELSNDIVFAFFKNHQNLIASKLNKEYASNFDKLMKGSIVKWAKAKQLRKRGYDATSDKNQLELLVSAQKFEDETISEIEKEINNFYSLAYTPNNIINYDLFTNNNIPNKNITNNKEIPNETDFAIAEVIPKTKNNIIQDAVVEQTKNNILVETPHKIYYKIQVGAFLKNADESVFKGINPIVTEKNQEGFTRYLAGEYYSSDVAVHALKILKDIGFNDAFMVTYDNGIRTKPEIQNKTNSNLAKN